MASPVLVLAAIAATTALIGKPPAWLGWLPPWAAAITDAVLLVLGAWVIGPWATRRQAATEAERRALEQLRVHLGREDRLARIGEPPGQALALRIHRAIPLPPADDRTDPVRARLPGRSRWARWLRGISSEERGVVAGLDRDLPRFVEREKSGEVRAALAAAREKGGFVVVVGDSCVGKSRILYESARQELGDFAVLAPDLGDGRLVNTIASATFPLPKLIIWLDELHRFLEGPYLQEDETAITTAAIRQLLQAPTPVVILAAMWPEHASQLRTTRPHPAGGSSTGPDQPMFPRTVDILTDPRVQQIALRTFSDAERTATAHLAATDARLATALDDRTYNVTETLAGAPELVHRYERATREQQAIIHAAVDARRLGIQAPLADTLLAAAACGYLARLHPDDTWFPSALTEISAAGRASDKATAPLIEILNAEHTHILGYTVADYLLQHLTRQRRSTHLPALTWQALADHPHPPDDTARLATSAQRRLLYRYAEPLHQHLADVGNAWAADQLAGLLAQQGRADELRQRANAGDDRAASGLIGLLIEQDRTEELVSFLRQRADAGEPMAVAQLLGVLINHGRVDEAISIQDQCADYGAHDWLAADRLARLLVEQGRTDELRQRANAGDGQAEVQLIALLVEQGRTDELRQRADAGDLLAADRLAEMLVEQGRTDEAISVLRQWADADRGEWRSMDRLVGLLVEQGRTDEAISFLHQRADAGDRQSEYRLAALLREQGRTGDGELLDADRLAQLLAEQGRTDELHREVAAGTPGAGQKLILLLTAGNETRSAGEKLRRFGLNPDGSIADDTAERD